MACTVFTRLFHATNLFPRPHRTPAHPYPDDDATNLKSPITSSSTLERTPSLKRETATMAPDEPPKPYASIKLSNVPVHMTPAHLDAFFQTLPQLVRVHKSKSVTSRGLYELLLDFEPGVNVCEALGVEGSSLLVLDNCSIFLRKVDLEYEGHSFQDISQTISQPLVPGATEIDPPTGRRVKIDTAKFDPLDCHICCEKITGQPFSTPCLMCRWPQCYSCVRNQFQHALKDFESFPARCCDWALHPDVAKGILSDDEHERYRMRFEEWIAKDRTYCPVPTCSAFIPSRTKRTHAGSEVKCHACRTAICLRCKSFAHPGQPCGADKGREELIAILKSFGYKQCPKCGSAVGKMYGCNHIACKCGAHWCWDCMRKIEDCTYDPCEDYPDGVYETRDDNDNDDGDSFVDTDDGNGPGESQETNGEEDHSGSQMVTEQEDADMMDKSEVPVDSLEEILEQESSDPTMMLLNDGLASEEPTDTLQSAGDEMSLDIPAPPDAIQPTHIEPTDEQAPELAELPFANDAASEASETPVNLDDPTNQPWEHSNLDFGNEPIDDDHLDIWGCRHSFPHFTSDKIPRYWMTASDAEWWEREPREVACVRCWEPARVVPFGQELDNGKTGDERKKWARSGRNAKQCVICGIVLCSKCRKECRKGNGF